MKQSRWAAVLLASSLFLPGCHKNATEFDPIVVPPLPGVDAFFPTSLIDRDAGGGSDFLVPSRSHFSQTTLLTGQVLIAGGTSGGSALRTAEIYDQRPAEFFLTGSLQEARRGHTATLTGSGDLVVIGGLGSGGSPLISAEVYRPSSGSWVRTQRMGEARFGHTATRLSDGNILVAGGVTSSFGTVTDTCQILDVNTLLFHDATPIQAGSGATFGLPRAFHTATAVPWLAIPPLGDEGPCDAGNTEEVVVLVGGLTGSPGGPATTMAASVAVFYPQETTPGPGGLDRTGRWQAMIVPTGPSSGLRWAHQAHRVECDPNGLVPRVGVFVGGGLSSFAPPLGALTSSVPGASVLEDSRLLEQSYAKLTIDVESLRPGDFPTGGFSPRIPIGLTPTNPFFVGGAGARSVFQEGLPGGLFPGGLLLYAGGNSYDPASNSRLPYSPRAYLIDPVTLSHFAAGGGGPFMGMSAARSFFGISLLPGPDNPSWSWDHTILVAGGQFAPTGESATAEEYAFPP